MNLAAHLSYVAGLLVLLACAPKLTQGSDSVVEATSAPVPATVTGLLRHMPDGNYRLWECYKEAPSMILVGDTAQLGARYREFSERFHDGTAVSVQLHVVNPSSGQAELVEVVRIEAAQPAHGMCRPYRFWATGNEPFWSLVVWPEIELAELRRLGEPTLGFEYTDASTTSDSVERLYLRHPNGQRLKATFRHDECTDSMNGNRKPYSVTVDYAGQSLTGCSWEGSTRAAASAK